MEINELKYHMINEHTNLCTFVLRSHLIRAVQQDPLLSARKELDSVQAVCEWAQRLVKSQHSPHAFTLHIDRFPNKLLWVNRRAGVRCGGRHDPRPMTLVLSDNFLFYSLQSIKQRPPEGLGPVFFARIGRAGGWKGIKLKIRVMIGGSSSQRRFPWNDDA